MNVLRRVGVHLIVTWLERVITASRVAPKHLLLSQLQRQLQFVVGRRNTSVYKGGGASGVFRRVTRMKMMNVLTLVSKILKNGPLDVVARRQLTPAGTITGVLVCGPLHLNSVYGRLLVRQRHSAVT